MDLVTETDKECEALILAAIQGAFPSHKFIGEEGSAAQARLPRAGTPRALSPRLLCLSGPLAAQGFTAELTDEPTWMVDPLGDDPWPLLHLSSASGHTIILFLRFLYGTQMGPPTLCTASRLSACPSLSH